MNQPQPSLLDRLALAFKACWRILAGRPEALGGAGPGQGEAEGGLRTTDPTSALQLLALLQKEGRLVDFLEEEVAQYSDAEIGAAVRVVHEGCRKVLREHFTIEPVVPGSEGGHITLEPGFDARSIIPVGNLVGEPPFSGTLVHRGWRAAEVRLPRLAPGHDSRVLVPAEVEL